MPLGRKLMDALRERLDNLPQILQPEIDPEGYEHHYGIPSSCSTAAPTTSPSSPKPAAVGPTQQGSLWNVPGVGLFSKKALYTFEGSQLPDGLQASVYKVDDVSGGAPFNHQFVANNVQVSGGNLNLLVPGPQSTKGAGLKCAEITTTESKILYGSVRTVAMFSQVEGTCHGAFYYLKDSQEIDIEYLTDPSSLSNNGVGSPIPIWYSNQAVEEGGEATQAPIVATNNKGQTVTNLTTQYHEYRIDWTPDRTSFYFDGIKQADFADNVPYEPGYWIWNNWANGDQGWSVGPPKKDNTFKIKSIEMYYNTSSSG